MLRVLNLCAWRWCWVDRAEIVAFLLAFIKQFNRWIVSLRLCQLLLVSWLLVCRLSWWCKQIFPLLHMWSSLIVIILPDGVANHKRWGGGTSFDLLLVLPRRSHVELTFQGGLIIYKQRRVLLVSPLFGSFVWVSRWKVLIRLFSTNLVTDMLFFRLIRQLRIKRLVLRPEWHFGVYCLAWPFFRRCRKKRFPKCVWSFLKVNRIFVQFFWVRKSIFLTYNYTVFCI